MSTTTKIKRKEASEDDIHQVAVLNNNKKAKKLPKSTTILPYTDEQKACIESNLPFEPTDFMEISAYAGAGKTTTIKAIVKSRSNLRFLYIVLNKKMSDEAKKKLKDLPNVDVSTYHALGLNLAAKPNYYKLFFPTPECKSYQEVVKKHVEKSNRFKYTCMQDAQFWTDSNKNNALWIHVMYTLDSFANSRDRQVEEKHCYKLKRILKEIENAENNNIGDVYESNRRLSVLKKRPLPCISDTILVAQFIIDDILSKKLKNVSQSLSIKLLHLLDIDLSSKYDVIAIDECQDALPVLLGILDNQPNIATLVVGDAQQAINGWLGAIDAKKNLRLIRSKQSCRVETYTLSESFRFSQNMADFVNKLFCFAEYKIEPPLSSKALFETSIIPIQDDIQQVAKYLLYELPRIAALEKDAKTGKPLTTGMKVAVISRSKIGILNFIDSWIQEITEKQLPLDHFKIQCSDAIKTSLDDMCEIGQKTKSSSEISSQINKLKNAQLLDPDNDDLKSKIRMMEYSLEKNDQQRQAFFDNLSLVIHPTKFRQRQKEENEAKNEINNENNNNEDDDDVDTDEQNKKKRSKKKTSPKQRKITLNLLTAHSSKGLEFPVVVAIDIDRDMTVLENWRLQQQQMSQQPQQQTQNQMLPLITEKSRNDSLFIMYVLITRTQYLLYFPEKWYSKINEMKLVTQQDSC